MLQGETFYKCKNLKSITAMNSMVVEASISDFEYVDKEECIVYVPEALVDDYKHATGWRDFAHILPIGSAGIKQINNIKTFNVYDLLGRKVLTNVTSLDNLPKGLYIINGKKVLK